MDNKHISNTIEASSEVVINNCTEPNVSNVIMNTDVGEDAFYAIINSIKEEDDSSSHDEFSDLEHFSKVAYKSLDNKNKKPQPDEICELASHEKDVNQKDVNGSNLQELTDTKLVDDKIVDMQTNSLSTALPVMKILSSKLGPHTCLERCFRCDMGFRVLDSPLHICRIRSIDKQNELLKIEPLLSVDSCLCDFCWKDLEKTYKSIKSKNRKEEESFLEKRSRLLERYVKKNVPKNKNQARKCSMHVCSRPYCHKISVDEYENIKKLFLTFKYCRLVFVESTKQTIDFLKFPYCLCDIHNPLILVMSTCQICGDKLNAPFNTDDWSMHKKWNSVLIENNLPLILKPGMFICVTCKEHISKENPGFPPIVLKRLREHILISNAVRLQLYGESETNSINICQTSTDVVSPIVVPKIEEKKCIRSIKVKFSDPLITAIYNLEISTALLNVAEQDLYTPKLEQKDSLAIVNPVSIKRKLSNIICDTISNKNVKKQDLNEKYSSYEDNSTDDNTSKSYRNKNIAHPSINPPSILSMTSNCKNKYDPNSDSSFSETNSVEILTDCKIKETDYIVVASDDDLSLNSD